MAGLGINFILCYILFQINKLNRKSRIHVGIVTVFLCSFRWPKATGPEIQQRQPPFLLLLGCRQCPYLSLVVLPMHRLFPLIYGRLCNDKHRAGVYRGKRERVDDQCAVQLAQS